jgi:hypothetical protein
LTFSASRLIHWKGRRPLGALLALVYLWVFAALGLTHTHAAPHRVPERTAPRTVLAASPATPVIHSVVPADTDAPCAVCATAHATPTALAAPPTPVLLPSTARRLVALFLISAPARGVPTFNPRAPPQA